MTEDNGQREQKPKNAQSNASPASAKSWRQPKNRLHSQLDMGTTSAEGKHDGREPVMIHPQDAEPRGLTTGAVARIYNDRGACLASVIVSADVQPGVIQISTGAWFDPDASRAVERHGNPNVLTLDKGTSRLAQGPSALTALVEIERYQGKPPRIEAFDPPLR